MTESDLIKGLRKAVASDKTKYVDANIIRLLLDRYDVPGRPPAAQWVQFGTHAGLRSVPALTFSDEVGEDGLPNWELHPLCTCDFNPTQEEL